MFDTISEWFGDLDMQKVGLAFGLWAVCLIFLWKGIVVEGADKFLTTPLKIALSVIMLPISYIILHLMGDR